MDCFIGSYYKSLKKNFFDGPISCDQWDLDQWECQFDQQGVWINMCVPPILVTVWPELPAVNPTSLSMQGGSIYYMIFEFWQELSPLCIYFLREGNSLHSNNLETCPIDKTQVSVLSFHCRFGPLVRHFKK